MNTKKCLVVDDMPSLVNLIKAYIENHPQLEVILATVKSEEAVNFIEQYPDKIDLIFTDLDMPGYSGLDILQRIEGSSIKAFLITGSTITEDDITSSALIQLIYKPISPTAFNKAIDNYLTSHPN
ncbi:response regulator [Tunicatimonas pelagia]|uniref:response regulator n=1 Tax=Tunicatimonas pelagia TaxID=931531 RepID=UPI0026656BE9|nr:response regulator [Tunicatimonas pelagia]WKN46444.1 response regulator [Tunicatimonas pelagia]